MTARCPNCSQLIDTTPAAGVCPSCGAASDPMATIRGADVLRAPTSVDRSDDALRDAHRDLVDPPSSVRTSPGERPVTADAPTVDPSRITRLEGLAPVTRTRVDGEWEQVLGTLARSGPLAVTAAVAAAALTISSIRAFRAARHDAPAAASSGPAPQDDSIVLPAVSAQIGLTADNREEVLNVCNRASDNAVNECRIQALRDRGELPGRVVDVPALRVDRTEVSNARYEGCVADGACPARDWDSCRLYTVRRYELGVPVPDVLRAADRPAVCVTFDEATAACAHRGMRLPTDVEWERAARAGTDLLLPWGTFWAPGILNWGERDMGGFPIPGRLDGEALTAPVDAFPDGATRDGLLQMIGNVAEWVSAETGRPGDAAIRGGSYADDLRTLRATYPSSIPATQRRTTVGFRCVGTTGDEGSGGR